MKRFSKIMLIIFAFILFILIGLGIAIQTPYVQSKISTKVIESLNKQFGTAIEVGSVDIDFWGDVKLYDVKARDHRDSTFIKIPKLIADIDLWDIYKNANDIKVESLTLIHTEVDVITYKGEDESNFIQFIKKFVIDSTSDTESEFKLQGNISIEDSRLSIVNHNLDQTERVWLDANELNATISNIDLEGTTYKGDIENITFVAKKNSETFTVKEFQGLFYMNKQSIVLKDLVLNTDSSLLSGDIEMNYDSIKQFDDFENKVNWNISLNENNYVGYKDIRYFVPSWSKDQVIQLQGNATGPINNLLLQEFSAKSEGFYLSSETLKLSNIINGDFDVRANNLNTQVSYNDITRILPIELEAEVIDYISRFGLVTYKGELNINNHFIHIDGNAKSALGSADLDVYLDNYQSSDISYKGNIATSSFDLKKLIKNDNIGVVKGAMKFNGSGTSLENLVINADGNLDFIDLSGYRYQNLSVNGVLEKKSFDGAISINDPNAILNYNGLLDFSKPELKLDFESKVEYINLNHFGIATQKNTWIKTNIKANTRFSNLNDLSGQIELSEITLNADTINLTLPQASIFIGKTDTQLKSLLLDIPGYIHAKLEGLYQIEEIPDVLQNGVGNFLVEYDRKNVSPNQIIEFEIEIEDDIISYFIPNLYIQPTTHIQGVANDREHLFELRAYSPYIQYQEYKIDSVVLNASTSNGNTFDIHSKKIEIENIQFNKIELIGKKSNDSIIANTHFYVGNNNLGKFDLNFYQVYNIESNSFKTGFAPSEIEVEDRIWHINPENNVDTNYAVINLEKNQFQVTDILIQSEEQFLRLNGDYLNKDNFKIDADLENLDLSKLIPSSLLPGFDLRGIANGTIDIVKNQDEIKPVSDIRIEDIYLNEYYIGNFTTTATYDTLNSVFELEGSLDRNNINTLYLTGSIDNKGDVPELDLIANLDDFRVSVLGVFLEDILNEWTGELSGDVTIQGDPFDPNVHGVVTANDLGFQVVFLGTKYQMQGENELDLSKFSGSAGSLNLPDIGFTEITTNTHGTVEGSLIFSSISTWFLDLEFNTDRLLVMNTTVEDNELFYGRVFGRGEFEIYGPADDLEIFGLGVDVLKGSSISLNTGGTSSVDEKKFIQFYAYDENGQIIENEENNRELTGIALNFSINADEGTEVNLVLDAQTDDKISARGIANDFQIHMNEAGKLNIDGEYTITDGTYNYREYFVIDKDFDIEEGGYIRFSGDPFNAALNVKAIYSRYVNNIGEYIGTSYSQPTMVDLVIAITGSLENTDINFDITTPDASSQIASALESRLTSTTDELLKQASFLLVLGRFGSSELLSAGTATGAATASAFELLGKQVGNIFSSIIPGLEINPTYLQSNNRGQESDKIQTQLNWAINDRLRINGAVGTPVATDYNETVTTSVEVDYDISKVNDGSLIIRGFSRPTTLGIENYNSNSTFAQSYGLGVIYSKSFNSFKDLFASNPEELKVDSIRLDSMNNASNNSIVKKVESFIIFKK